MFANDQLSCYDGLVLQHARQGDVLVGYLEPLLPMIILRKPRSGSVRRDCSVRHLNRKADPAMSPSMSMSGIAIGQTLIIVLCAIITLLTFAGASPWQVLLVLAAVAAAAAILMLGGRAPARRQPRKPPAFRPGAPSLGNVLGAGMALLLLAPLLALIGVAIRIETPGPILVRHRRRGSGAAPLWRLGFRTAAPSAAGPLRPTRVGAWLLRTGLYRLPQLWHVVRGEMSLSALQEDPPASGHPPTSPDAPLTAFHAGLVSGLRMRDE